MHRLDYYYIYLSVSGQSQRLVKSSGGGDSEAILQFASSMKEPILREPSLIYPCPGIRGSEGLWAPASPFGAHRGGMEITRVNRRHPPGPRGVERCWESINHSPLTLSIFSASPLLLRAEWFSGKRKAELMKPQAWHRLLAQGAQPETFFSHQQKLLKLWGLRSLSFLLFKGQIRLEGNMKDTDKGTVENVDASICSVRPRGGH